MAAIPPSKNRLRLCQIGQQKFNTLSDFCARLSYKFIVYNSYIESDISAQWCDLFFKKTSEKSR